MIYCYILDYWLFLEMLELSTALSPRNATPSEATLSVINKLLNLSFENSAIFGEHESRDGYGSDASSNPQVVSLLR
jgi:hypothetical protein